MNRKYNQLKAKAHKMSIKEVNASFNAIFKGATVKQLKEVLKANKLTTDGAKSALLNRLARAPRNMAASSALTSW